MKLERTPREILSMIKRRKVHVIEMALAALLGAGIFLIVKPRSYESTTRIRVEGVASLDGRADAERLHGAVEEIKNSRNFDEVVTTRRSRRAPPGTPGARAQRRAEAPRR